MTESIRERLDFQISSTGSFLNSIHLPANFELKQFSQFSTVKMEVKTVDIGSSNR